MSYCADSNNELSLVNFCIDSVRSVVGMDVMSEPKGMNEGGRRDRHSEKAGAGKTVRALTRTFVTVSGCSRCGLNWYL